MAGNEYDSEEMVSLRQNKSYELCIAPLTACAKAIAMAQALSQCEGGLVRVIVLT